MPYVLSKLANSQIYTQYAKVTGNRLNIPVKQIEIKGGSDVTNKHFITPNGVITKVTADELEVLRANRDFQRHLEKGHVKYFAHNPNVDKEVEKLEKDKSAPLTPDDYKKKGKKAPKITVEETEE